MQVIKLGGSLEQSRQLTYCLDYLAKAFDDKIIIVPGGGRFAEQVRQSQYSWQFDEVTAHEMAILAMQQMALLIHSLCTDFKCEHSVHNIQQQLIHCPKIIWSPEISELNQSGIKESWTITSDSLAAWLATQVQATQLTLIKAANFANTDVMQLAKQGIIDSAFPSFIENAPFKTQIISADQFCK